MHGICTGNGQIILPSGVTAAEIQQAIDNDAGKHDDYSSRGTYNLSGGFHITTPHLTIILSMGTVIQNSSPCFNVNASYTTITSESIGGAKCVPTDGANGINVAGGLAEHPHPRIGD